MEEIGVIPFIYTVKKKNFQYILVNHHLSFLEFYLFLLFSYL